MTNTAEVVSSYW